MPFTLPGETGKWRIAARMCSFLLRQVAMPLELAWGQVLSSAHHAVYLMRLSDTRKKILLIVPSSTLSHRDIVECPEKDTVKRQPRLPLHPTSPMTAHRAERGTVSVLR